MSTLRLLFWVGLIGCGGGSHAETPVAPPPPAPAAPAQPAAPAPAAPAAAPASTRLNPPQTWEEIGHNGDQTVLMGTVVWTGGEAFEVNVMGTMAMMLRQEISQAIQDHPDDPGAAIQGVIDEFNSIGGEDSPIKWVRKK